MSEMIIRPTMKFIYMGYAVVVLIVAALVIVMMRLQWPPSIPSAWQPWIPWLPVLLLLWPLKRHVRNRLTKMTILDDRLRYETGILSRTTRTVQLSKVQDVTVHQRIGQRIFGVGDLSIETAGKSSRQTIVKSTGRRKSRTTSTNSPREDTQKTNSHDSGPRHGRCGVGFSESHEPTPGRPYRGYILGRNTFAGASGLLWFWNGSGRFGNRQFCGGLGWSAILRQLRGRHFSAGRDKRGSGWCPNRFQGSCRFSSPFPVS